MDKDTIFFNGRILTQASSGLHGQPVFADSMLVKNGTIAAIGQFQQVLSGCSSDVQKRDLDQQTVLPSFIDGHMHLLLLGQSLRKLDLRPCKSLEDIRSTIKQYAVANPRIPTILCKNWMHSMTPNGVTATMLDELDPRPIFIDASSQHSCWMNTAALKVLVIWPFQAASSSKEERMQSILQAIHEYNAAGYTGVIEMAMDEEAWNSLVTLRSMQTDLPIRIAAYWLIKPTADHEANSNQVQRAIELSEQYSSSTSPDLRIVGIKVICDGIIDACTAFLSEPYAPIGSPPPIWEAEHLASVVKEADSAGLQIALHAIGDGAIKMAIDSIEKHASPGRRHRIEHIELASPEDAKRLGELGLTASIQPVHADPSILTEWPRLIGEERCERAFAYREFADAGALMAIGTDSPTAPWAPMNNLYVATTRKSSRNLEYTKVVNEHFRLGMCESIVAASGGAARSVFAEERTGSLEVGKLADFIVVDMEWEANALLQAKVKETWLEGRRVWG
ncbi:hypothetical protein HAV15_000782 [Penicillium sp. str. |nr:hypothetical protein HAV15_000782 [Penicillium sp. str. \